MFVFSFVSLVLSLSVFVCICVYMLALMQIGRRSLVSLLRRGLMQEVVWSGVSSRSGTLKPEILRTGYVFDSCILESKVLGVPSP